VTTVLHVTHPRYLPVRVWLDFRVWRQAVDSGLVPDPVTSNQVRDDLTAKIRQFLHPLKGGLEGLGWEMGQDLTIASLFDFLKPDSELGFIADLKIEAQTPLYTPTDRPFPVAVPGVWLQVLDYEIICSAPSHNVTVTKV
jgi:hypothetical protein